MKYVRPEACRSNRFTESELEIGITIKLQADIVYLAMLTKLAYNIPLGATSFTTKVNTNWGNDPDLLRWLESKLLK